jgi:deoxyribodipyrimidine photo-lyase
MTVVLFTRDLRLHDHPALTEAVARGGRVVPLFVLDTTLLRGRAAPNRLRFLLESLADLDDGLRKRGGRLVLRSGDVVGEALALAGEVGARAILASADVSHYAQDRQRRLASACAAARIELRLFPGVTVAEPGRLRPAGGDHFRVFTPYWTRWRALPRRPVVPPPHRVTVPDGLGLDARALLGQIGAGGPAVSRLPGGETIARARLEAWCRGGLARYPERHQAPADDGTSRLGAYLHLGCVSPSELAHECQDRVGGELFLRQLCWRDFHHQVAAAFPAIAREDYRPRGRRWHDDAEWLAAWKAGRTGYPLVDAGMRQLAAEGWMHNRARLVAASFLVKDLGLDWRLGAAHFLDLLVDGDVVNNAGNWQWVAGTGNDTRPHRVFNPVRQAARFDPEGDYVRCWVPELAGLPDRRAREPWRLDPAARRRLGYPAPIVDHDATAAAFQRPTRGAA